MPSNVETAEQFDLAQFEVEEGYFIAQVGRYEEKYKEEYPHGWGEFFAAYLSGRADEGNLDYDEWAFLCEHFMSQLWIPPGDPYSPFHEKPETISGFSFLGDKRCLNPIRISVGLLDSSKTATSGPTSRLPRP